MGRATLDSNFTMERRTVIYVFLVAFYGLIIFQLITWLRRCKHRDACQKTLYNICCIKPEGVVISQVALRYAHKDPPKLKAEGSKLSIDDCTRKQAVVVGLEKEVEEEQQQNRESTVSTPLSRDPHEESLGGYGPENAARLPVTTTATSEVCLEADVGEMD
jgi:hypothetical protein